MITKVTVFVDYDSARRIGGDLNPYNQISLYDIFEYIKDHIANYLSEIDNKIFYNVHWRIYHGWFSGRTKTQDRLEFEKYLQDVRGSRIYNVSFSTDYKYSDIMLCDSQRMPLYNTLHRREDTGKLEQKMVDTALACDVLHSAKYKESGVCIIIGDDDDLMPILFCAEAWKMRIVLLTRRKHLNRFLNLNGLVRQMRVQ